MNGNGELTEAENVIIYISYRILTDERNSYVLLNRTTAIRERRNGYVTVETTHNSNPVEYWQHIKSVICPKYHLELLVTV